MLQRRQAARLIAVTMLALLAPSGPAGGQSEPEPPYQRASLLGPTDVHFAVTTQKPEAQRFFDQALQLLHEGADFEAERSFRQVAAIDPTCSMAWWGMSLAAERAAPSRALACAWQAYRRRDGGSKRERAYIEAWARFLGAQAEPTWEIVDAERGSRRAVVRPIPPARHQALLDDLAAIGKSHPDDIEAAALSLRGLLRRGGEVPRGAGRDEIAKRIFSVTPTHPAHRYVLELADRAPAGDAPLGSITFLLLGRPWSGRAWHAASRFFGETSMPAGAAALQEAAARADHALMARTGALPYEVEGYVTNLRAWRRSLERAGRHAEAAEIAAALGKLPRHPRWRTTPEPVTRPRPHASGNGPQKPAAPPRTSTLTALGPLRWEPRPAANFELPRGRGGRLTLADLSGRPLVLVFYLGFGCIHCVEQLGELEPRAGDFRRAGLELVTIGTDDVAGVRASFQQARENGDPIMPFPVLCDPKGDTFKAYGCWDDFEDEALHGTFVIDGQGRILWRDVSVEPFMETDFLLAEAQRLVSRTAQSKR